MGEPQGLAGSSLPERERIERQPRLVRGSRVSACVGDFIPLPEISEQERDSETGGPQKRRRHRARLYGNVVDSVERGKWKVRWDRGDETVEPYGKLKLEDQTAGGDVLSPSFAAAR